MVAAPLIDWVAKLVDRIRGACLFAMGRLDYDWPTTGGGFKRLSGSGISRAVLVSQ